MLCRYSDLWSRQCKTRYVVITFLISWLVRGGTSERSDRSPATLSSFWNFASYKCSHIEVSDCSGVSMGHSCISKILLDKKVKWMVLCQLTVTGSLLRVTVKFSQASPWNIRCFRQGLSGMYFHFSSCSWFSSRVVLRVVLEHCAAFRLYM